MKTFTEDLITHTIRVASSEHSCCQTCSILRKIKQKEGGLRKKKQNIHFECIH